MRWNVNEKEISSLESKKIKFNYSRVINKESVLNNNFDGNYKCKLAKKRQKHY